MISGKEKTRLGLSRASSREGCRKGTRNRWKKGYRRKNLN